MEDNVKKEGSYLTGIIGAIIGGAIATIPWVLAYVYGNVMLSLLAVLIGAGEFYGYKIFRGKIDKKLIEHIFNINLSFPVIMDRIIQENSIVCAHLPRLRGGQTVPL